ncbi:MAG: hypothetical protein AAF202_00120 [Pseudomonadota bacterium]
MDALKTLVFVLFMFFFSSWSLADSYYLQVTSGELTFYAESSELSEEVAVLAEGAEFSLSKKRYGAWRKATLEVDFQQETGWIKKEELTGRVKKIAEPPDIFAELESQTEVDGESDPAPTGRYFGRAGLGVALTASYMSWGERSFRTSDDAEWSVAEASSTTAFVTVFADMRAGEATQLRPYINLRTTNFEGESTSDFLETRDTSFSQAFRGFGSVVKFYLGRKVWWWGLGLEGAQGQSLKVKFDGDSVKTSEDDLGFYLLAFASVGRDIGLWGNWYFLPELRSGLVTNQQPNIYFVETNFAIGYSL